VRQALPLWTKQETIAVRFSCSAIYVKTRPGRMDWEKRSPMSEPSLIAVSGLFRTDKKERPQVHRMEKRS
jgi:hypothetical protein